MDQLSKAKCYTKLDLHNAYHRVWIQEGDEWKMVFRTRYGYFEYLVILFDLPYVPATFQTYINRALAGLVDVICIVYLDDILIYLDDLCNRAMLGGGPNWQGNPRGVAKPRTTVFSHFG